MSNLPNLPNLRGVARGARQAAILECLLSPDGCLLSEHDYSKTQTGRWGSAGWKAFDGMRPRIEAALSGSAYTLCQLPLGPRGGKRWVITDRLRAAGLTPEEIALITESD